MGAIVQNGLLTLAELPEPDCDHARFGHFSSLYTRKAAYFSGF